MKIIFIINAKSSQADTWQAEIQSHCVNHTFEIWQTKRPGHAVDLANEAYGQCDVLVAVGGDGTLHEVINGCMQSTNPTPAIGILPAGTANDFTRSIGLDGSLQQILALAEQRHYREIDIGKVSYQNDVNIEQHRYFINSADIGLGAEVVKKVKGFPKLLGANLTYALATLATLFSYSAEGIVVSSDERTIWTGRSILLAVCKGQFFGSGLCIAPTASVDDGKFSLTVIGQIGVGHFMKYLGKLRSGAPIQHAQVHYLDENEITVTCQTSRALEADGEFLGYTPATFRVLPAAVRFLAP